jgi:hypothetical protein
MNLLPTKPNRWRPITVFNLLVGLLFSLTALAQPASLKSTYKVIDGQFTWEQAQADAVKRGGHLATIANIEEQLAVVSLGFSKDYWLGGTDSKIEGQWEWVTGEPFTYSNWRSGEPNGQGRENHLMIVGYNNSQWNDGNGANGDYVIGYILEIPDRSKPVLATAIAQLVNGFVVGATITSGGNGYTNNPVITITGGGGTGAKATATQINGVVTSITINNSGSGYTSTPTISIAPPPFPPRKATSTADIVNGFVVGAKITDGGFGYDTAPTVLLIGGGGSGATATATVVNGMVTAITIINSGSGYTSAPSIQIASPPFAPSLDIEVSKVSVRLKVVLGRKYQLEASTDFKTWTSTGPAFVAQAEELAQEFDVNQVGQYFRINQVP